MTWLVFALNICNGADKITANVSGQPQSAQRANSGQAAETPRAIVVGIAVAGTEAYTA
jgi:hypothetical protein